MASEAAPRLDMSLDDIIKLNKKQDASKVPAQSDEVLFCLVSVALFHRFALSCIVFGLEVFVFIRKLDQCSSIMMEHTACHGCLVTFETRAILRSFRKMGMQQTGDLALYGLS